MTRTDELASGRSLGRRGGGGTTSASCSLVISMSLPTHRDTATRRSHPPWAWAAFRVVSSAVKPAQSMKVTPVRSRASRGSLAQIMQVSRSRSQGPVSISSSPPTATVIVGNTEQTWVCSRTTDPSCRYSGGVTRRLRPPDRTTWFEWDRGLLSPLADGVRAGQSGVLRMCGEPGADRMARPEYAVWRAHHTLGSCVPRCPAGDAYGQAAGVWLDSGPEARVLPPWFSPAVSHPRGRATSRRPRRRRSAP